MTKVKINTKTKTDRTKSEQSASALARNLRILLDKSHLSEHELSRRTGVKQPIINRILSSTNTNPKLLTLRSLADYFLISVSQLIGESDITDTWRGQTSSKHQGWMDIPVINKSERAIISQTQTPSLIPTDGNVSKIAFAYFMTDNSMEPLFPIGCFIIAEPNITPTHQNYIVIKNSKSELLLRMYLIINKKKYIMPLNNSFGTISALSSDDAILGTVVRTIYDHRHAQ